MAKKAAAKIKKSAPQKGANATRPAVGAKKSAPGRSAPAKKTVGTAVKKQATVKGKKPVASKPAPKKPAPKPVKVKAAAPVVKKPAAPVAAKKAPQKIEPKPTLTAKKPAAVTPAPKPAQVPPAPRPVIAKKKPLKERFQMEFQINSTPSALYDMLLSPSGFSEWYCDDVDLRGDEYTFKWGNEEEKAQIIGQRQNEVTRFRRNDDDDPESYFEFRIKIDPITNELALIVTDHAWPNELDNSKALWASQIANLTRVLGA